MTSLSEAPPTDRVVRARESWSGQRKVAPIRVWAWVGAGVLALQAYIYAAWIVSGNATPTPTGPTPVPGWMRIAAHTWEVVGITAFLAFLWFLVIRPWRRNGRLTLDGLFILAFLSLQWQDPVINYTQAWYSENSVFFNLGSWTSNIPGWSSPNGHLMPQPVLWTVPAYIWLLFGGVMVINRVMAGIQRRCPRLSNPGLIGITWLIVGTVDLLLEPMLTRLGFYHFGGSIRWLTINAGTYYQFPIYEAAMMGGLVTAWACVRYFRDDHGRTLADRGIEQMRVTGGRLTAVRGLALVGLLNVVFLAVYNIPAQFFGLHADTWPTDITTRSYFTNGLCGEGTTYACPGPGVPIPRRGSRHLTPDGSLSMDPMPS